MPVSAPKKTRRACKGQAVTPPPGLRLEWMDPADLNDNPLNWRRHPEKQTGALAAALEQVGWAGALLYNEQTKHLIDGHARKKVSLSKTGRVPVLIGSWTEEQEKLILATLDPLAAMAEADTVALDKLLREVGTGNDPQLDAMLAELGAENPVVEPLPEPGAGGDDFDATPETGPTRTKVGELWVVGGVHRLLVGDCTVAENVTRLMGGEKAGLVATDPPYAVNYDGTNHPKSKSNSPEVRNKDWSETYKDIDVDKLAIWLEHAVKIAAASGCAFYQWHAQLRAADVFAAWQKNGLLVHQAIIWVKSRPVLTHSHYMWQHEPAFYGWVQGSMPALRPASNQTTVWRIDKAGAEDDVHPTQKPLALFSRPIETHLPSGGLAYEPFSGSGTTLIAAHRLNRRCYGCEIEPRYADVILKRAEAENLTVEKAS